MILYDPEVKQNKPIGKKIKSQSSVAQNPNSSK